jgi:hypothetical protein
LAALAGLFVLQFPRALAQSATYVVHISVDGLRPDAITALGPGQLPNFYRLRTEGAFTYNARSDHGYTITLPNHVCQLTGRHVSGPLGHNWDSNSDPAPGETLASNKGRYVAGVFDVVHNHGLRTGAYAGKSKFSLFPTSWNAVNGALDRIGPDNGRNKIDVYVYNSDTLALVNQLIADMGTQPFHYAFLHVRDPDTTGHDSGWDPTPGTAYSQTIKAVDGYLGLIFGRIDSHPQLAGHTAIVLTADHGGSGYDHSNPFLAADYTVPFCVWGPGVMCGADLYTLNPGNRRDPGTRRPGYFNCVQPVRNAEAANVALNLLGLEPVPGSTIDRDQDLAWTIPPPADLRLALAHADVVLTFSTVSNVYYDIQCKEDLGSSAWNDCVINLPGIGGMVTHVDSGAAVLGRKVYRLRLHF